MPSTRQLRHADADLGWVLDAGRGREGQVRPLPAAGSTGALHTASAALPQGHPHSSRACPQAQRCTTPVSGGPPSQSCGQPWQPPASGPARVLAPPHHSSPSGLKLQPVTSRSRFHPPGPLPPTFSCPMPALALPASFCMSPAPSPLHIQRTPSAPIFPSPLHFLSFPQRSHSFGDNPD